MATFDELMGAAVNADKAGDTAAAQQLVDMARSLRGPKPDPGNGYIGYIPLTENDPLVPTLNEVGTSRTGPEEDNFGDTIKAATKEPIAATKAFAAGFTGSGPSPTGQALPEWVPEWVPDWARSEIERGGDAAGTLLSALATAYGFGAGLTGEMLGGSPTNEKKLARDLMMMGQVAVPELAGVSSASIAAQKSAQAATALSREATATQKGARAADDLGITPSAGAGGKVRGMTAATLEKVPLSGGSIAKDATRFVEEVEGAFNATVAKIGPASGPTGGGTALQSGLNKFVSNFKAKSDALYANVGQKIPKDTKIKAVEAATAIRETVEDFAGTPEIAQQLGLNKWARMADDLESGNLTWRAAIALRSDLGKAIGKMKGPLKDLDDGRVKLAYGKLTEDLEAAAKAAGPEAFSAWKRATTHYKRGAERISKSLDKTITAQSPERAFEAFVAMAKKDRASADARRMFEIKASMPKEEWREVSASIIDRLGRARPGAQGADGDTFSPGTFLTEWNKLSPEAKSVLIPGNLRKEMDKLAEVADLAKGAGAERNFSNTGTVVTGAGVGAAATQAPMSTAAFLGAAWGSAKLLTNPRVLRALNKHARGDSKQLKALANGNSAIAQDVRTVLRISAAETAATEDAANLTTEPLLQVSP